MGCTAHKTPRGRGARSSPGYSREPGQNPASLLHLLYPCNQAGLCSGKGECVPTVLWAGEVFAIVLCTLLALRIWRLGLRTFRFWPAPHGPSPREKEVPEPDP